MFVHAAHQSSIDKLNYYSIVETKAGGNMYAISEARDVARELNKADVMRWRFAAFQERVQCLG